MRKGHRTQSDSSGGTFDYFSRLSFETRTTLTQHDIGRN